MEENENLVEETTENVEEQTTEEIAQEPTEEVVEESTEETVEPAIETFTKEQVDEMIAKKLARKEAKLRKEYKNKYGKLENVVNAGLGTTSTEEAVTKLTEYYTNKGITIPEMSYEDDDDIETLGTADADKIISLGYEDIVDEVERLNDLGIDKMSKREKVEFVKLATERKRIEDLKELSAIGVSADLLDNKDFTEFAKKLNPNLSLKEQYEMYLGSQPKKEINKMGSMKNTPVEHSSLKEFYTKEEAMKFTNEDYDKYPELENIVIKSMSKW